MCLESPAVPVPRRSREGRAGKLDTVVFRTDQTDTGQALGKSLSLLGGVSGSGGVKVARPAPLPQEKKVEFNDKSPVFLTQFNVSKVHEPEEHAECVKVEIDADRILKSEDEFPSPVSRWDGGWHGTAESRLLYLRAHKHLWGFCRPDQCKRKTNVFFVKKKDGNLRKILACVNFNQCCEQPPKCTLPGTWNIQKIRFAQRRFFVAESDVSAYYSRLEAPPWMKFFLCLDEVTIGEIFDLAENESFTCPYTGETFRASDVACPCWPRLPMGWSWSVALAVEKADQILNESAPPGVVSLNQEKDAFLPQGKEYCGSYIDNLFTLGEVKSSVNRTQRCIDEGFQASGLVLSTQDEAEENKKLLGVQMGQGKVTCPDGFLEEIQYISTRRKVAFWRLDKAIGKCSWLFPLKRRFFSLLYRTFHLLARLRTRDVAPEYRVSLSKRVRAEFAAVSALGCWLYAELVAMPSPRVFACDASTEGWAIVDCVNDRGFIQDTGVKDTPLETQLLGRRGWRLRKRKWFRRRLDHCLVGEICGFRQTAMLAAREHPNSDLLIYTDNSNVYHAVRKGRSNSFVLNELCRIILLIEIIFNVRIHPRWCGTQVMPADKYTRRSSLPNNGK